MNNIFFVVIGTIYGGKLFVFNEEKTKFAETVEEILIAVFIDNYVSESDPFDYYWIN
jgi:hypothetical protein